MTREGSVPKPRGVQTETKGSELGAGVGDQRIAAFDAVPESWLCALLQFMRKAVHCLKSASDLA